MKRFTLMLAIIMAAALTGCSQSNGGQSSSSSETISVASQAVPAASTQGSQASSSVAIEPASEATTAASAPATESAAPETSASSDVTEPAASSEAQASPSADNTLSGVDLNVRFGDNGSSFALHLYDNETAAKIAEYVGTAEWRLPIYHYDDYENWEVMQYYDIPSRYEIPSSPVTITSEKAGEIYYSDPNRIILFFGDAKVSSEYTPVGYIDYSEGFVDAVENNPVLEGWGNKIVIISK